MINYKTTLNLKKRNQIFNTYYNLIILKIFIIVHGHDRITQSNIILEETNLKQICHQYFRDNIRITKDGYAKKKKKFKTHVKEPDVT